MGLQRVRQDLATEPQQKSFAKHFSYFLVNFILGIMEQVDSSKVEALTMTIYVITICDIL